MSAEVFCDTNIWVYAVSSDPAESNKKRRSLEIIQNELVGVSVQVLQEFYVTVTRKIRKPLEPKDALKWIEAMEAFPLVFVDPAIVKVAIRNSLAHKLSYWDGAILAGAERLRCSILYSEDLNDRQHYAGVRVVNPYT